MRPTDDVAAPALYLPAFREHPRPQGRLGRAFAWLLGERSSGRPSRWRDRVALWWVLFMAGCGGTVGTVDADPPMAASGAVVPYAPPAPPTYGGGSMTPPSLEQRGQPKQR